MAGYVNGHRVLGLNMVVEGGVSDVEVDGVSVVDDEGVANIDLSGKQDKLTAGSNITIVDNVISATGGGGGTVDQRFNPTSTNAQSGVAVHEAVAPATSKANNALDMLGNVPEDTDVQSEIDDLDERVTYLEEHGGVTQEQAVTLNALLKKIAYIDSSVSAEYNAFKQAWNVGIVTSISAVFTQSGDVYPTTPINNLKNNLVVTATFSDETTSVLTANEYELSGVLEVGTSTITVTYGDKTDTFDVVVTEAPIEPVLDHITAVYSQGSNVIYPSTPLANLKNNLTVTAIYTDQSEVIVNDYTLSGTLAVGTSTITVTYETETTTFSVVVTEEEHGRLPSEYQEVAWIKNTNTPAPTTVNSYINLGIKATNDTSVEFKAETSGDVRSTSFFGANTFFAITSSGSNTRYRRKNVNGDTTSQIRGTHIYKMMNNGECYFDENLVHTFTATDTFTSTYDMLLFCRNSSDGVPEENATQTIYYYKQWEGETLVRDLVPCYRKADNEIGMYDLANEVFYTNAGTGSFTKGADVN